MATVKFETFPYDEGKIYLNQDSQELQDKVRKAIAKLCHHELDKNNEIISPPYRLNPKRDWLKADYREIWKKCVIEYDENDPNATAYYQLNKITIGPVFMRPTITALDMEKVLLHEFLHLALSIQDRAMHHSFMEQIIKYHLKYPGDANPFCPL